MSTAGADWLHIDVMDGHFVPNITIGAPVVRSLRKATGLILDCHLMIENPQDYIDDFAEAGSDYITVHAEACPNVRSIIKDIRSHGVKAGISIKPKTSDSSLKGILNLVDMVLVMTVEPGFGGQRLIPSTLNKVRQLVLERERRRIDYLIQIDGGINAETAPLAVAAGADVLVAGSAVFRDGKVGENVRALRQSLRTLK